MATFCFAKMSTNLTKYKSGWIISNLVPTAVKTWGGWISDQNKSDNIILIITGNPGVSDFYEKFLQSLHELINIPVWVLCHAGQQIPPAEENLVLPSLNSYPNLYNIEGQVKHKKDFITTYIPESKNIYLIGHSVGAKICVELMKDLNIAERVKQVHLLCPTLQYIGDTPNGVIFRLFLRRIAPFLISLAWLFTCLHLKIRTILVQAFAILYSMSLKRESCCISGLLHLFTPQVLRGVFLLANDEMVKIKELDNEVYEQNYDKMYAYYAQRDRWAPLSQYEDLKKKHPQIRCKILDASIDHSFVFKSSEMVAAVVAEEIKRNI